MRQHCLSPPLAPPPTFRVIHPDSPATEIFLWFVPLSLWCHGHCSRPSPPSLSPGLWQSLLPTLGSHNMASDVTANPPSSQLSQSFPQGREKINPVPATFLCCDACDHPLPLPAPCVPPRILLLPRLGSAGLLLFYESRQQYGLFWGNFSRRLCLSSLGSPEQSNHTVF